MMFLRLGKFLILLVFYLNVSAQISVEGSIFFGSGSTTPLPNWPVDLYAGPELLASSTSQADGSFSFTIDTVLTDSAAWSLQVLDLCSGSLIEHPFTVNPDENLYLIILQVCSNINPPDGQDTCLASFAFQVDELVPTIYTFSNLSSSTQIIDSVLWDFGNGETSTDYDPLYDFDSTGNYTVSLTIYSGSCEASEFQLVQVFNPAQCDCGDEIEQVCVLNFFGQLLTFNNSCLADCAGYEPAEFIDCNNDCGCPPFDSPICVETITGDTLSFTNHCFAECEGYGPEDWISCEEEDTLCDCEGAVSGSVCINVGNSILTFASACEANCAGFSSDQFFDCDEDGNCVCTDFFDPVCVIDSMGDTLTFDNICLAACEGYSEDDWFVCDASLCACPVDTNIVCVLLDEDNQTFGFFPNACAAECAGFLAEDYSDCEQSWPCDCPPEEDPVCVILDGTLVTFANACRAACFNFSTDDFVDCNTTEDPATCQCSAIWNPVCVETIEGDTLSFQNPCWAGCAGYEEESFVACFDCACEGPDFPACYFDPDSQETVQFVNICEALCAGYPQEELFYCFTEEDCVADFAFTVVSANGLTLSFTDQSFSTEPITGWQWDFGDGFSSSEETPIHSYAEPGFYTVTLRISTVTCIAETSQHIVVGHDTSPAGPICQSFFFFEQPDPANLLLYQFVDQSVGTIGSWIWDFGDGSTSFEQNPLHSYAEPGSYNVTLTTLDEDKCESSFTIVINAGDDTWYGDLDCRAWFLPILDLDSTSVLFLNFSSFDAVSYDWDFGDGGSSTDFQPFYQYASAGVYTVTLTITTASGCENTYSTVIDLTDNSFTSQPQFALINNTRETRALDAVSFSLAPNPTRASTRVAWEPSDDIGFSWQLFDINGRPLQQGKGQGKELVLDLSEQRAGIYLLRMQTAAGAASLRIIKL